MAVLHRKLLPLLTSPPNLPAPCLDFCDPSCSNFQEDCYLLPDPILYPPDPSPLPPPPPADQGFHIPTVVIAVIIVLVLVFLLLSYCAIFVKWTRLATRRNPGHPGTDDDDDDDDQAEDLDGGDSVLFNPIWLISTVGLQQSVINSITKINYKEGEGLTDERDCSVCLSEFQEGESLRLLPKCDHAFHIDCIDTWLRSHTNCPLCRAAVVVNPGQVSPFLGTDDPGFEHSRRTELTEMDLLESNDGESGSSLTGDGSLVSENRGERETEHCEYDAENGQNKTGVARSVSMDFCLGRNSRNVGDPGLQWNPKSSSFRMMGSSSSSSWRALGSSSQVKRSNSWGKKVFGSARYQKPNPDPESSS